MGDLTRGRLSIAPRQVSTGGGSSQLIAFSFYSA